MKIEAMSVESVTVTRLKESENFFAAEETTHNPDAEIDRILFGPEDEEPVGIHHFFNSISPNPYSPETPPEQSVSPGSNKAYQRFISTYQDVISGIKNTVSQSERIFATV